MPTTPTTPKLDLLRMLPDWQFGDESFNRFIDDADNKLLGITHEDSPAHWSVWSPNSVYNVGDVVRITNTKSHQYYQCTSAGTSGLVEPTNNITGSVVLDNDIQWLVKSMTDETYGATLKIWLSGNRYVRGDAVIYGTALYRCKVTHDSTTWNNDNNKWQEILASIRRWYPNIYYFEGDTVVMEGYLWQCTTSHTAGVAWIASEKANWVCLNDGRVLDWSPSTSYVTGDLVISDNIIYRCAVSHTSDATSFTSDRATKWNLFHTPNATIRDWVTSYYYEANQTVLYSNNIYRCNTAHTSSSFNSDIANWDIVFANIPEWITGMAYQVGATVLNDNKLYRCNTAHISGSTFASDIAKWDSVGVDPLTTAQLNAVINELKL